MKKMIARLILICMSLGAFTGAEAQTATYTVGGIISSLAAGKTVVLKNNTSTLLVSSTSSSFTFPAQSVGTSWNVSVAIQPSGQTCTVSNASGTNINANVTNVGVTCINTYTVGGTVSGLTGASLVLRMGTISLVVSSGATTFKFASGLKTGTAYNVLAAIQPPGFSCSVTSGIGVITTANITNVAVTCVRTYTISGTVSGLTASGLTLRLTYTPVGASSIMVNKVVSAGATAFAFSNGLKTGSVYQLDVIWQPTGLVCQVLNGSGTVASSNVTNVSVVCESGSYTVSGSISGLTASGLSLSLSGAKSDSVSPASGATSYAFTQTLVNGNSYTVTISAQPTGLTCILSPNPATGTVGTTNIVVNVTCAVNTYTIAVTNSSAAAVSISGSTATNATNPNSATSFNFSAKHGDAVVLSATKTGNTCSVTTTPASINPITGNATATVSCTLNTYTVGGTNADGASVAITNSSVTGQVATTADPYSFNAKYGDVVTLSAAKTGYSCSVAGSPITVGAANVTNANVSCAANIYTISGTTDGTTVVASGSTVSNTVTVNAGTYSVNAKYGDLVTLSASKTGYSSCVIAVSPITVSGDTTANVSGCTINTYTITVTNTPAASLSISGSTATNATNPNSATSFTFSANYGDNVSFSANKAGYDCSVTPLNISLISGDTVATVTCSPLTIGGTVTGLGVGNSVRLLKTIGNNAPAGTAVGFATPTDTPAEIPGAGNYGWSFSLVGSQKVSALGLYNNDFYSDVQVGLWNSSGVLLASGVFSESLTNLDLSDVSASGFMWLPITEINLGPGLYTVGAYSSTDHFASYNVNVNPISGLTINKYSLVSFSSVFELPSDESVSSVYPSGFFGPNIKFSGMTATNESLDITSNGGFYFPTPVSSGDAYTVTVETQPVGQTCEVLNSVGVVGLSIVTTVQVNCTTDTYSISVTNGSAAAVTISGSSSTNATNPNSATSFAFNAIYGDNVSLAAMKTGNTCSVATTPASINPITSNATATVSCTPNTYTICLSNSDNASIIASGSSISNVVNAGCIIVKAGDVVTLSAAKSGYTCSVAGSPINVVSANVILSVSCMPNTYSVGGTNADGATVTISYSSISGQSGTSANPYSFNAKYGDVVTLTATKTGYNCSVSGSPITVGAANVTNANVSCTLNTYVVSVNNIQGAAVTLTGSTATGNISPNSATSISFNATHGDNLGLSAAKTGYTCTVTPASITSIAANSSASVSCTSAGTYTVSGKLTGNTGTVTLLNNGTNSASVLRPKGTFSFSSGLGDGSAYNVTVSANPTGQICLVLNGSGVIAAANITNVMVSCTTNTYTLGGTVSGLGNGLSVVLLKNGSDALSITANGSFTFASPMAEGAYVVSIGTQPLGQSCVITNGSGTVGTTNITNITVTCSTNVGGCSSAGNAGVPSSDPFWAIYSAPTSPGVDTTPLITSELPNLFQSCLQGT